MRMATPYRAELVPAFRLPATFHASLDAELAAGEKVLWVGLPNVWRLRVRALEGAMFALFWNLAIAGLISAMAKVSGAVCLFGVPFLMLGLSLFTAPSQSYRDAAHTFYALTDRRAIVFEGAFVMSVPRARMREVGRELRADGSGDLVFYEDARARATRRVGFYGVASVREVEVLIGSRDPLPQASSSCLS